MFAHAFVFENLRNTVPLVKSVTEQLLDTLKTDGKTPINCVSEIEKITSEVILRSFFGYEDKDCLKIGD